MDACLRRSNKKAVTRKSNKKSSNKKEDLATLRGHLWDLVRWARADGLQIRHVWFEQLSASKAYVRRREFEKATQAIVDGKSKTLGVWKTDRFDRRGMGRSAGCSTSSTDGKRALCPSPKGWTPPKADAWSSRS